MRLHFGRIPRNFFHTIQYNTQYNIRLIKADRTRESHSGGALLSPYTELWSTYPSTPPTLNPHFTARTV